MYLSPNISVHIHLGFFPSCVITYSVNNSTNIHASVCIKHIARH